MTKAAFVHPSLSPASSKRPPLRFHGTNTRRPHEISPQFFQQSSPTSSALEALSLSSIAEPFARLAKCQTAPPPPVATSVIPVITTTWQLAIAFCLGGIFTKVLLPRMALAAWTMWNRAGMSNAREKLRNNEKLQKRIKDLKRRKKRNLKRLRRQLDGVQKTKLGPAQFVLPQYVLDKFLQKSLKTQLQKALEDVFKNAAKNPNIGSVKLKRLKLRKPPKILRGAYYDLGKKALAFDATVAWRDALELEVDVVTQRLKLAVPVKISQLHVRGTVRVLMTPLLKEPPGFGAIVASFTKPPQIQHLQIDVGAGAGASASLPVTKLVPLLQQQIIRMGQSALTENLVWPNRNVQPARRPNMDDTLLTSIELQRLEKLQDPFGLVSGGEAPTIEWKREPAKKKKKELKKEKKGIQAIQSKLQDAFGNVIQRRRSKQGKKAPQGKKSELLNALPFGDAVRNFRSIQKKNNSKKKPKPKPKNKKPQANQSRSLQDIQSTASGSEDSFDGSSQGKQKQPEGGEEEPETATEAIVQMLESLEEVVEKMDDNPITGNN